MCDNYIVHPKLTEHCKSTVTEKKMLLSKLLETMKYIIQIINVLILIKKKVTWNCLILFHMVKLPSNGKPNGMVLKVSQTATLN